MLAPALIPSHVRITRHAIERYLGRRHGPADTDRALNGIDTLLAKAARRPTPPLRYDCNGHEPSRCMAVGGYWLVFSADMSSLITLWRLKK